MPKWVQSSAPERRTATASSIQTDSSTSCATPCAPGAESTSSVSGTSAGVVGTTEWPRRCAIARPAPSLPVFGSDCPPVARTTTPASRTPCDVCRRKPPSLFVSSARRVAAFSTAPHDWTSRRSASSTSRERLLSGNSLPWSSSWRGTPSDANQATVSATGSPRRTRRTMVDLPPQKSRSVTDTFVTLHRDPPLTRILAPGRAAPSRSVTEREGSRRRMKIAVARPAAPAPTTAMSVVWALTAERRARRPIAQPRPSWVAGPHHPSSAKRL
jgi:hypothetical protein